MVNYSAHPNSDGLKHIAIKTPFFSVNIVNMLNKLFILWLAAFPLMGSPGPATLSLAALGSVYGIKKSLAYYIGIVAGTSGVLLLIALGLTGLLLARPDIALVVSLIAAAYILYLAFKIATAPVDTLKQPDTKPPSLYAGFLLAIANPKAFAAIGAVYSGHTLLESNVVAEAVLKIAALVLVILIVNLAWLAAGDMFSSLLKNPRTARIVNIVFAILLVLSVGFALLS